MSLRINQVDQDQLDRKLQKESKAKKLPKVFKTKVSIEKVNMKVIKNWIDKEVDKILKDDDIVADYLYELLIADEEPNIKQIHLQMIEFFSDEQESLAFCTKLWELLISGSKDVDGIPAELINERKKEMEKGRAIERHVPSRSETEGKAVPRGDGGKTNYNRSQYNASKRTRSPDRRDSHKERDYRDRGYRERDYRERDRGGREPR